MKSLNGGKVASRESIHDGNDITIGGEQSPLGGPIRMTSRKDEIKKQVTSENSFSETVKQKVSSSGVATASRSKRISKSEILKDLEWEQTNHSATPCNIDEKKVNARSDWRQGVKSM